MAGDLEELAGFVEEGLLDLGLVEDILGRTRPSRPGAARLVRLLKALVSGEVAADAEAVKTAVLLGRQGAYPTARLSREPSLATWLSRSRWRAEPMPPEAMRQELDAYFDAERVDGQKLDATRVAALLRSFRHRQLLRIFLREIEGASVRQTTAEVADVAQLCLEMALREGARIQGEPELADEICVMGMGKLGGRELNFSSDIDLIFLISDQGMAQVGSQKSEALVRRVVELIDDLTDDGRVFRVDLRLRPEGSRGRLLLSATATVDYYLTWGRTWERGAWLKARPVAGNLELGERVLEELEPFLYRRHLDFDAIDELRRMKTLIDEESRAAKFLSHGAAKTGEVSTSTSPFKARLLQKLGKNNSPDEVSRGHQKKKADGPGGWDVKIGRGGIREIEFFVQALQLVHCGSRTGLRVRTTLEALDRLLYTGLLSASDHADLSDAYDLFRRLEHRVQMEGDRQFHRLPEGGDELDDLAGRMEMSAEEMTNLVEEARTDVRAIFDRLFSESPRRPERATVGDEEAGVLERIIGLPTERLMEEEVLLRLRDAGFERPRQVAGQLQVLRQKEHGPFSDSPVSADHDVARYLLRAVRDAPDSEAALGYLVRFATTVGNAPSMWAMLSEHPHAARLLIHLFGSSPPLARLLAEEPDVFERLIYGGSARLIRLPGEMEDDLSARIRKTGDRARRMGRIRRFHREEVVRIALHEVAGSVPVETTCQQLADLAEVILRALFREVVDEFASRHKPLVVEADPVETLGLAVVALGKLGGREMGFGSDLDFIFVYDPDEEKGLDQEAATRLARRLVRALSAATAIGGLYEVDLRLRPSGSQGTLVVSFDSWRDYHLDKARLWERQTLIRARTLTGESDLRRRLDEGRRELAFERQLPEGARQEISAMRDRLSQVADANRGAGDGFDVKNDPGGLVDVEFVTQWLQLTTDDEGVQSHRSTVDALRAMEEAPGPPSTPVDLAGLVRDYQWLRRLECRLDISGLGTKMPAAGAPRRALVRQMGHQGRGGEGHFDAQLEAVRGRVRQAWGAVFGE